MDIPSPVSISFYDSHSVHEICASLLRCALEVSEEASLEFQKVVASRTLCEYLCGVYPYVCCADSPEDSDHMLQLALPHNRRKGSLMTFSRLSSRKPSSEVSYIGSVVNASFREGGECISGHHSFRYTVPFPRSLRVKRQNPSSRFSTRHPKNTPQNHEGANCPSTSQTERVNPKDARRALLDILEGFQCFLREIIVSISKDINPLADFSLRDDGEIDAGEMESANTLNFGLEVPLCSTPGTPFLETFESPAVWSHNRVHAFRSDATSAKWCQESTAATSGGHDWLPRRHSFTEQRLNSPASLPLNSEGVLKTGRVLCDFVRCALFGEAVVLPSFRLERSRGGGDLSDLSEKTPSSPSSKGIKVRSKAATPAPVLNELRCEVYTYVKERILAGLREPVASVSSVELDETAICHAALPWWLWSFAAMGLHEIETEKDCTSEGQYTSSMSFKPLAFLISCTEQLVQKCVRAHFRRKSAFSLPNLSSFLDTEMQHESMTVTSSSLPPFNELLRADFRDSSFDDVATKAFTTKIGINAGIELDCECHPVISMQAPLETASPNGGSGTDGGDVGGKLYVRNNIFGEHGKSNLIEGRNSSIFSNNSGGSIRTQGAIASCINSAQCAREETKDISLSQTKVFSKGRGDVQVTQTVAIPDENYSSFSHTFGHHELYSTATGSCSLKTVPTPEQGFLSRRKPFSESISLFAKANSENVEEGDCEGSSFCFFNLALAESAVSLAQAVLNLATKLGALYTTQDMNALLSILPNASFSKQHHQQRAALDAQTQNTSPQSDTLFSNLLYPLAEIDLPSIIATPPSRSFEGVLNDITDINTRYKGKELERSLPTSTFREERAHQVLRSVELGHLDGLMRSLCSILHPTSMLVPDARVSLERALHISLRLLNHIFAYHFFHHLAASLFIEPSCRPQTQQKSLNCHTLCSFCLLEPKWVCIVKPFVDSCARAAVEVLSDHQQALAQELIDILSLLEVQRFITASLPSLGSSKKGLADYKDEEDNESSGNPVGLNSPRLANAHAQPHADFLCVWLSGFQDVSETTKHLLKYGYTTSRPFETVVWYLAGLADYLVQVEQCMWRLPKGSTTGVNDIAFDSLPLVPPHHTENAFLGEVILPVEFLHPIVEFIGTIADFFMGNISGERMRLDEKLNSLVDDAEDIDDDEMNSSQNFIYRSEPQRIARSLKNFRTGRFHWVKLCMHYFLEIIDVQLRCSIHLPEKPMLLYSLVAGMSRCSPSDNDEPNDRSVAQQEQHDISVSAPHPSDSLTVAGHRSLLGEDSSSKHIPHFVSSYSCAAVQKLLNKIYSFHAGMRSVLFQNKLYSEDATGGAAVSKNEATFFLKCIQLESTAHNEHETALSSSRFCSGPFINSQITPYNNPYRRMQHAVSTMCWPTESFQHHCRVRRILEHAQLVTNFLACGPPKASQHILGNRGDSSEGCLNYVSPMNEFGPVLFSGVAPLLDIVSGPCAQLLLLPFGGTLANILPVRDSLGQDNPSLRPEDLANRMCCTDYNNLSIHLLERRLAATCDWLWVSTCLFELLSSASTPINYTQCSSFAEAVQTNGSTTAIKGAGAQKPQQTFSLLLQNTLSVLPNSASSTYVRLLLLRVVRVFYFCHQLNIVRKTDTECVSSVNSPHPYLFYRPLYKHWKRYCESLLRALRTICWNHRKAHQVAHILNIPSILTHLLLNLLKEEASGARSVSFMAEKTFPSCPGASLAGQGGHSDVEPSSGSVKSRRGASTGPVTFSTHKDRSGPKIQRNRGCPVKQREHQPKNNSKSSARLSAHGNLMPPFSSPTRRLGRHQLKGKDLPVLSPFSAGKNQLVCRSPVLPSDNSFPLPNGSALVPKLQLADMGAPSYLIPFSDTEILVEHIVSKTSAYAFCEKTKTQSFGGDYGIRIQPPPFKIEEPLLEKDTQIHKLMDSDHRLSHSAPLCPAHGALNHDSDCSCQATEKHPICGRRGSRRGNFATSMSNGGTASRRPIVPPLFEIDADIDPASVLLGSGTSSSKSVESFPSKRPVINHYNASAAHTPQFHASFTKGFMESTFSTASGISLAKFPSIMMELILSISSLVLQRESGFVRYGFTISSFMQNRSSLHRAMMQPESLYCLDCVMDAAVPSQESQCDAIAAKISSPQVLAGVHVLSDLQCYLEQHCHEPVVRAVKCWLDEQYGGALRQLAKVQLLSGAKCQSFVRSLESCAVSDDKVQDSCSYTLLHQTDALFKPLASGHYTLLRLLLPRRDWLRNFSVCRRISAGGFGSVYRATPLFPQLNMLKYVGSELYSLIDRQEAEAVCQCSNGNVAIKFIPVNFRGGRSASLSLCHSEVLALHRLRGHPHIISLLSYGCSSEEFFIITPEYMGGSLLSWRLAQYPLGFDTIRDETHATITSYADDSSSLPKSGPSPCTPSFFSQCASIFTQVLAAVEFSHRHAIRHGDLKANNVFIEVELQFTTERGEGGDPKSRLESASTVGNANHEKGSATPHGQVFRIPTVVRLGDFGSCDSCSEEDMHILFCEVAAGEARFMASRWGSANGTEAVQPPEAMVPRRRYQIFRGILNEYLNQSALVQKSGFGDNWSDGPPLFETLDVNATYRRDHLDEADPPRAPESFSKLEVLFKRMQRVELSADIWGCGCLLYELLTGCMLFGGSRLGNLSLLANTASHTVLTNSLSSDSDTFDIDSVCASSQSPTSYRKALRHLSHNYAHSCTPQRCALSRALNEQEQHELAESVGEAVLEFLCQLLSLDPLERPTAHEALRRWEEIVHKTVPSP